MPDVASVRQQACEPCGARYFDFAEVDVLLLSCPRDEWIKEITDRAGAAGAKFLLLLDDPIINDPDSIRGIAADGVMLKHELTTESLTLAFTQMRQGGFPMPSAFRTR